MSRTHSQAYRHNVASLSPLEPIATYLLIDHASLSDSIRVVNDVQDYPYGDSYKFQVSHVYALNTKVVPSTFNGYYYNVSTAGTTAGAEPTWPTTISGSVTSGSAIFTCIGFQYAACGFTCSLPEDLEKQAPRASLSIDNVSAMIGRALEAANGARGATCRVRQGLRSQPSVVEIDLTLGMSAIKLDSFKVTADLSYKNLLDAPAIRMTYTPKTAPGVF